MLKKITLLASLLCAVVITNAQDDRIARHLPADAGSIITIDLLRLNAQLPAGMLQESGMYKKMMGEDSVGVMGTILKNPGTAGIDLQSGVTVVLSPLKSVPLVTSKFLVTVLLKLKDAHAFTSIMTKKGNALADSIRTFGTDRILHLDEKTTMGWNNQWLVFVAGMPQAIADEFYSYQETSTSDSITISMDTAVVSPIAESKGADFYSQLQEKLRKAQRNWCFDILGGQPTNPFDTDATYEVLMKTPGDIRIWSNATGSMTALDKRFESFQPLLDRFRSLRGSTRGTWINFENGRVRATSQAALTPALVSVYEKYPSLPQDFSLVRRLPPGKPLILLNTTFNEAMQQEMFSATQMDELLQVLMEQLPAKIDFSPGTFKSQVMFAIIDPATAVDPSSRKFEQTELIIAMPIADKMKFEKLKTTVLELVEKMREESKGPKNMPVALYNDELLVISRNREAATAFLTQLPTGPVPPWMADKADYPVLMNFQLHNFLNHLLGEPVTEKTERARPLIDAFNDMLAYGGKVENGWMTSTTDLRFTNEKDNALVQLFSLTRYLNRDVLSSGEERPEARIETDTVPSPALDSVSTAVSIYPIPVFKDKKIQAFAVEFAAMATEYVTYLEQGGSSEKGEAFNKKGQALMEQYAAYLNKNKDDLAEMQKLSDWVNKVVMLIGTAAQQQETEKMKPAKPVHKKPVVKQHQ